MKNINTINVDSMSPLFPGRVLSNLFESPFILDGVEYRSIESFWQSLKYPEGSIERNQISTMEGSIAKLEGKKRNKGLTHITYLGRQIQVGSEQHHLLLKRALFEKFSQNPELAKVLIDTRDRDITHILVRRGVVLPDSPNIPGKLFCIFLKEIREVLVSKNIQTFTSTASKARLISASFAYDIARIQRNLAQLQDDGDFFDNSGEEHDDAINQYFSSLRHLMKRRDIEYLRMLREYGIDISKIFGISGEVLINNSDISLFSSESSTRAFLSNTTYNKVGNNKISSRGLGYYFNLPGFTEERKVPNHQTKSQFSLNVDLYYGTVLIYAQEVCSSLKEAVLLGQPALNVRLFLLDHLRNILLFLKGQALYFYDSENITRVMSTGQSQKKGLGKNYMDDLASALSSKPSLEKLGLMDNLDESAISIISEYFSTLVRKDSTLTDEKIDEIFKVVNSMVESASGDMGKLLGALGENSKTLHTRLIMNTVRVFREADIPVKTYYACMNFISGHRYELGKLDSIQIVGMPYGGTEIPYVLRYVLEQELPHLKGKIFLDYLVLPPYSYRGKIPFSLKENEILSPNIILTDDNVNSGNTVLYAQGILAPVAQNFYKLVVDGTDNINPISISVLDTIAGFVPMDSTDAKKYGQNQISRNLRNDGVIGRV